MANEIKLQALKENVDTVEVNALKVAPGDVVAKDQPLLEVQADKAALDVLAPVAGRVTEVRVKVGDQIKIGQVYCLIEATNGGVLVTPDHPEYLARALQRLMTDPGHREALGRMGKEAVHTRFHADRMARDTLAVYARYLPGIEKGS